MAGYFILFEEESEGLGRITGTASAINDQLEAAHYDSIEQKFVFIPMDQVSGYVKINGDEFSFAIRPSYTGKWDKTTLQIGEEATLPDVPAGEILVTGPQVRHIENHPGGDFKAAFLIPGVYTVEFERFPTRPHLSQLTVSRRSEAS